MAIAGVGMRVASAPSLPSSTEMWGRPTSTRAGTVAARRGAATAIRCSFSFVGEAEAGVGAAEAGGPVEEHYRTLRLRPGSTRTEVKKAFRRLALLYHPDVCKDSDRDTGAELQKINIAYHILMNNMREAEERLEYWRLKYGLNDQDLDRYRYYLNEDDEDWLDM